MEPLFAIYICCIAVGLIALAFSFFGADIDSDGLEALDGGFFYVITFLLWFCAGFGIGGLIWYSQGQIASVIAGCVSGLICAVIVKGIIKAIVNFCKKNEQVLPSPQVGDTGVAIADIPAGMVGQIELQYPYDITTRCYARAHVALKKGDKCKITLIDELTSIVEPIN